MNFLYTPDLENIDLKETCKALEDGKVLYLPAFAYENKEPSLLSETILDGSRKNISYDPKKKALAAFKKDIPELEKNLHQLMQGYADFAYHLVQELLPAYIPHLQWGRTSFRPAQISNRALSKRKDDKRLHVDSFAASPVNGLRILRVFCNINPNDEPRVWHLGEHFSEVLERFAPQIPRYSKLKAKLLHWTKSTKTLRSAYDHYMLHTHDKMKLDEAYQEKVAKVRFDFPAHSSWIVFTDSVSHAALSGQHLLEQTFYLPVDAMADPALSPLKQWQTIHPEVA